VQNNNNIMISTSHQAQKSAVASKRTKAFVGLNPAQLHFLQILSHIKTDEALVDHKKQSIKLEEQRKSLNFKRIRGFLC
jgi:hypothetical protein